MLERKVINWDTSYINEQIHALIASTGYRGTVEVTFPITYSKVVVRKGKSPLD